MSYSPSVLQYDLFKFLPSNYNALKTDVYLLSLSEYTVLRVCNRGIFPYDQKYH